jgi:hypothetical protein
VTAHQARKFFSDGALIPFGQPSHRCHALFATVALQSKTITEQSNNGGEKMEPSSANFGLSWAREFAEQTLNQSKAALDGFLKASKDG